MGQSAHRARVADLLSAEPPLVPEEISYLETTLSSPLRVRYFTERALGPSWFRWASSQPAFKQLLDRDSPPSETSRILIAWVAERYILDEENSGIALRAFREHGWSNDAWQTIAHRLFAFKEPFPEWLGPWLLLTLQNSRSRRNGYFDMMLAHTDWTESFGLALLLLEDRTRPFVTSTFDFGTEADTPRFEVDLCGDEHWLTEAWSAVFLPVLGKHLAQLIALIDEQLDRVISTGRVLQPNSKLDSASFSRSAIESHEQDKHRDAVDVLIDGARDCIEIALAEQPHLADRYLETWQESSGAIFHRLALHGWRIRTDRSASEKLSWLLEREWLWDLSLQHEVFLLLRDALPTATDEDVRWLVEAAEAGPPTEGDAEVSPYRSFNLLAWLARCAPDLPLVAAAFDASQASHPEYDPRSHPDLNRYVSSGLVENALPFTTDELHALVEGDPTVAVARLLEFREDDFSLTGPTWNGALALVQACVAEHPADGLVLAAALDPDDVDTRLSIIRGWDRAALDDALADRALAVIESWEVAAVRNAACQLLSSGGNLEHPTAWHRRPPARSLAIRLWPTESVGGQLSGDSDLLMRAINHPAGNLAQFWTKVVQAEWSDNQDSWAGLPSAYSAQLEVLLSAADDNGTMAQAILASQLHFYFSADPEWCLSHLLPLFDWATYAESASASWQGFLTWGRPHDGLLRAGLLDHYLGAVSHSGELPSDMQRQLAAHLASIAMYSSIEPDFWLTRFVISAPEVMRISWARQIASVLADLEPSESALQWTRWVKAYWSSRTRSAPRPLNQGEASAMARWVLGLPTARSEAVGLVLSSPANLDNRDGLLFRLQSQDLTPEAETWTRLLTHLLANTSSPTVDAVHYLKQIVQKLRAGTPEPDLSLLIEEAMRLGCADAPDW
jgi:hypothetical protein